ncbi:M48 family metallopeptidase [Cytobacillus purgationiresistens]|uniref:Zn-dependent protease with chaperone function n=1 Tax=Cytobacillus purgationiresistens TaxID=863449 RepID=A0ABU0ALV8_9BACI|nr:M48 family metallopeptidase [Cytobacillus purgationiresistens]MDQ0272243.1 Zn-dependent protease with chaperone function [Cytobacillus purgationiresistens]
MENYTQTQLVTRKEQIYFALILLFSILIYLFLVFSIIGIAVVLVLLGLSVLLHGIAMGGIRRNGVKINERQFPELYHQAKSIATDMNLDKMPDIYVIESEGMLNAFATRFFKKDMVVLYSGIFDLIEKKNAEKEVLFVLAHEFAHLHRKHVLISMFLLPAMWVPFVGNAYLRACEYTCDRFAAYYVNSFDAAKNALTMLAIGKELYPKVNQQVYMEQLETESGFFVWLNEKLSTHPHLPKRIYELSMFFSADSTVELKESKRNVWFSLVGIFTAGVILSIGLWLGMKVFEKSNFMAEMALGVEETTALMNAAAMDDVGLAEELIAEGAEIEAQDADGTTALQWALHSSSNETAVLLLEHGADPNLPDLYDTYPLLITLLNEDIEMAELLLSYGADPTMEDADGMSIYDYAIEYDSKEFIKLIEQQ